VAFEQRLKEHLARQAAAHSDHLAKVLKVQEKELDDAFQVRHHFRGRKSVHC
jgi:hypothetical protein